MSVWHEWTLLSELFLGGSLFFGEGEGDFSVSEFAMKGENKKDEELRFLGLRMYWQKRKWAKQNQERSWMVKGVNREKISMDRWRKKRKIFGVFFGDVIERFENERR